MVRSDSVQYALTDLHTHILPGVDDGAENMEESLKILRLQKASGVERVILTPHFYPLREELQSFLKRRQQAYGELQAAWDRQTMPRMQLGAEVHYSPSLVECDFRTLTLGQSDYLLLELSDTVFPVHIEQILRIMQEQGITPILAHVERCEYFCDEPGRLVRLIEMGAFAQITAKSLVSRSRRKFAEICLQKSAAHIIASDIHNAATEKLCWGAIAEKIDGELIARAETFARAVWNHADIPAVTVTPIKRKLFGYV